MLAILHSKRKLSASESGKLERLFENSLPEKIRYSYTYADLNSDNFVINPVGTLKLIDLGSLQKNRVTDVFLFSHPEFETLCKKGFWKSYEEEGGPADIVENVRVLKGLGNLKFVVLALESLKEISFLDWRKRRSRKAKIQRLVADLTAMVS